MSFLRPATATAVALPLLAAAALFPAAASAATVTYEGPPGAELLVYRAAPGELNSVGVQPGTTPTGVTFYEFAPNMAEIPASCEDHRDYHSVTCEAPHGVRVELGDGKDSSSVSLDVAVPVTMLGGPGDDSLDGNDRVNTFSGEAGDDTLRGSGGDDVLDGGEGNDTLDGYSGADRLQGGGGDDLLHPDGYETAAADIVDGGPGVDRIEADYITRDPNAPQPPSVFTLAGGADDGRPGEGDDIRGVERFTLSKGARFVGTDAPEFVKLHQVGDAGELHGLGGADELRGGDGTDVIDGGAGDDLLDGGYGDDTITGGPGKDRISADLASGDCGPYWCKLPYGNDVVQARDGEADSITCGAGTDRVVADAVDVVAPDCETVERPAGGGSVPGTGTGGPTGPAARRTLAALPGQRLRTALTRGLRVRVTGGPAGAAVALRATVAGKVAATGRGRAGTTITLRFTKAARKALARRAAVRLTLTGGTLRATVTLRR